MATAPTQYIEVSSSNRNRVLYPSPANFDMDISQTGMKDKTTALDPVCDSSAVKWWNNSFQQNTYASSVNLATPYVTIGAGGQSDVKIVQIFAATTRLRKELNFYDGAVLSLTIETLACRRRIIWYQFIGTEAGGDSAIVWVDTAFPNGAVSAGSITDPTSTDTTTMTYPQIFVPQGEDVDNYYVNYILENVDLETVATVQSYDGTTHMLTLSASTVADWGGVVYNFALRKSAPVSYSVPISAMVNFGTFGVNPAWLVGPLSTVNDSLVGDYVRIKTPVPTANFSTNVAPYGENRRITSYRYLSTTIATYNPLPPVYITFTNASAVDDYYTGCIVEDTTAFPGGGIALITDYVGATKTAYITITSGAFVAGANCLISTIFTEGFSATLASVTSIEVLGFTRDNASVYNYQGSMISQQEPCSYEIELLNLVLPNIVLDVGRGGRIVFYPYVYVELSNYQSFASRNLIYSNNPSATRMLFRATVNDTSSPLATPFIRISGNGMKQTVKFKPNDNLHFSVRLPDGNIFSVDEAETFAPLPPNPLIQVSAVFAIKRV